jgi:dihydroflavonol-4-reductase
MKAFVTGSTGLLGSNLVRLLIEQGHQVKVLARSREKAERLLGATGAEIVIGDMNDVAGFADELTGCDVLFHAAAYFREYYQPGDHWPMLKAINVEATIELLTAAEARGVGRTIYVSSSTVIGEPKSGTVADETATPGELASQNLYAKSKVLAEQAIQVFRQSHSMPVILILPGWMYGPGDAAPTDSGRLVLDFLHGRLPGIVPGGASVVDARDVAQTMINAVERGRGGERYIVAGQPYSLAEICATLAEVSGVPAPRLYIPYPVALSVAWLSQTIARLRGKPTLMTVSGIRTLQKQRQYNSSKAMRQLGATFRPMADTLHDEIDWYKQHGYVTGHPAVTHSREEGLTGQATPS